MSLSRRRIVPSRHPAIVTPASEPTASPRPMYRPIPSTHPATVFRAGSAAPSQGFESRRVNSPPEWTARCTSIRIARAPISHSRRRPRTMARSETVK